MPEVPAHAVARLPEDWAAILAARGERAYRAAEVFRWIHRRAELDPTKMTSLPKTLREALAAEGIERVARVEENVRADDDTRKLLVRMADDAPIETVLIPRVSGPGASRTSPLTQFGGAADEDDADDVDEPASTDDASPPARTRVTQCISTQVGCAMGCTFCASGVAGLKRNLGPEEIVAQVLVGEKALDPGERITNLVYMGMGEPLHNYEATKKSILLLTHPEGRRFSPRRITVSTSGLVPEIARLGADFGGTVGLAISLHAAFDDLRSEMMPINRRYSLSALRDALRAYPLPQRRRITIEYTLIAGKNDSDEHARALVRFLEGIRAKVNLIPMNPIPVSDMAPSAGPRIAAFQDRLIAAGVSCFVRRRRGDEVAAACGQLALFGAKPKVKGFRKLPMTE